MTNRKTEHTAITGVCLINSLSGVFGTLLSGVRQSDKYYCSYSIMSLLILVGSVSEG